MIAELQRPQPAAPPSRPATSRAIRCRTSTTTSSPRPARRNGPQTDRQRAQLARSDTLVDELFAADVLVIAAPMINFTIPSNLKTWIDYVARAGRTFSYSEAGPQGLVTGKQVILVVARGGVYAAKPALDFQVPYLKSVLAFLGMTDVEVLEVEGTAYGPEVAEKAVEAATAKLRAVRSAQLAAAA